VRHPVASDASTLARWWLVSLGVWTGIWALSVTQHCLSSMQQGGPADWLETFAGWLPGFLVRALLSPLVLWLSARWLLNKHPRRRSLLHAGSSVLFALTYAGLHALVIDLFWPHASLWRLFQKILLGDFTNGILTYWAVLLVGHALAFYVWYRERDLAAARLDARLRAAELETLRMQLNPHFLFNALNTIGVLMKEDTGEAGRLLVRLSDLLRSVLANTSSQQTALRQELALLDNYLEIELSRFGDRLHIERRVDPEALEAKVPTLLLQPIVENAIRHGIALQATPGTVTISAERSGEQLLLEVTDDGRGWSGEGGARNGRGIGLGNTRARLEKLYGAQQQLLLDEGPAGGVVVRITIPFTTLTEPTAHA
jgi:two-component system, LytTR family, sensor kinase